jgi:hypothetical protein
MKVLFDLDNLRLKVPLEARKQKLAPQSIWQECMYIRGKIPTSVLVIREDLAENYVEYLISIDENSIQNWKILFGTEEPGLWLETEPVKKQHIKTLIRNKEYRNALSLYFDAQISENITILNTPSKSTSFLRRNVR